jgi:hypothetical protein
MGHVRYGATDTWSAGSRCSGADAERALLQAAERSAADFMKEYYTLYAFSVKWRANNLTSRGAELDGHADESRQNRFVSYGARRSWRISLSPLLGYTENCAGPASSYHLE